MTVESVAAQSLVTVEELAAMPDSALYELVEGELVPISPTGVAHTRFEHRLSRLLGNYVAEQRLGEVMVGERSFSPDLGVMIPRSRPPGSSFFAVPCLPFSR